MNPIYVEEIVDSIKLKWYKFIIVYINYLYVGTMYLLAVCHACLSQHGWVGFRGETQYMHVCSPFLKELRPLHRIDMILSIFIVILPVLIATVSSDSSFVDIANLHYGILFCPNLLIYLPFLCRGI